jgi:FAD/FMN-containing dehydrogenase
MREPADATKAVADQQSLIARGNGRSYGDAALNEGCVLSTLRSDHILAFTPETGGIVCEAGLLLADLLSFAVPRGFFPPVTPGTKFVTIGGMIASDVHGKNHHVTGSFGNHVDWIELLLADGQVVTCSQQENAELFAATCGGMGLTGIILSAAIRLMPIDTAHIRQETLRAASLAETMMLCEEPVGTTYAVAWIDCLASGAALGRSLIYRGEHALRAEVPGRTLDVPHRRVKRVPVDFPGWLLNPWSVRAFNELYYRRGRPGTALIDYDRFFYPLDSILDWNRIYGRRGFVQYQCVIPKAASAPALEALLKRISKAGTGSFLAVLKLLGPEGFGLMSFPLEGYTLALDFPLSRSTLDLFFELDAVVGDHGGRIYLAKDACASGALVRKGYPRLPQFLALRQQVDPRGKFASLQSRRLEI